MLLRNAADGSVSTLSHLFYAHKGTQFKTQLVHSAPNARYNGALAVLSSDLGTRVFLKRCLIRCRVTIIPKGTVTGAGER